MTKKAMIPGLVGAALMGWAGASLDARLGLSGWHEADLAFFAVGVILLAQAPYHVLVGRVRRLEAALDEARAAAAGSAR